MAEAKTKRTAASPAAFLAKLKDETTRQDCATLVRLMERITGEKAAMWGPSIVGFGTWHYVYASGTQGDWPLAAFSPRARNLTVYIAPEFDGRAALLAKLGPHTSSKSCLYVKALADLDLAVLERVIAASMADARARYPTAKTAKPAKRGAAKKSVARKKAVRKKAAKPARR